MQIPDTASGLLAELGAEAPAPQLRGEITGYDYSERVDLITLTVDDERVTVHAAPSGFVAVLGRLPHPFTLADVSAEVARLYGYPTVFCERRRVARPAE